MQGRQADPVSRLDTRAGNGHPPIPVEPVDRSHLLRKSTEFPFPLPYSNGVLRIRRERRVFESFTGIKSLSRRGGS